MSDFPPKCYVHEIDRLLGECEPRDLLPCWHCREPEADDIVDAFVRFMVAVRKQSGMTVGQFTGMPVMDVLVVAEGSLRDGVNAAVRAANGVQRLARLLGIQHAVIEQWDRVPADQVYRVAQVTGVQMGILRPDLHAGPAFLDEPAPEPEPKWTEEDWRWVEAQQLWLPLPYPPGFLPAHCCARRPRLALVASKP